MNLELKLVRYLKIYSFDLFTAVLTTDIHLKRVLVNNEQKGDSVMNFSGPIHRPCTCSAYLMWKSNLFFYSCPACYFL